MTDKKEQPKLGMNRPNKLQLTKTVESGKVKQNFTHGRSKTVTVEVRKTRTFARNNEGGGMVEVVRPEEDKATQKDSPVNVSERLFKPDNAEFQVRDKNAIQKATRELTTPQDEKKRDAQDSVVRAPVRERPGQAQASAVHMPAEPPRTDRAGKIDSPRSLSEDDEPRRKEKGGGGAGKNASSKLKLRDEEYRRGSGKLTVAQALEYQEERMRSLASLKRAREKARRMEFGDEAKEKIIREVTIPEVITVQDLANRMAERVTDVIKSLMKLGTIATANQSIDADTAELIVGEFGHKFKRVTEGDVENVLQEDPDVEGDLQARAPVVTIMGHVDHGKTSLLDAFRSSNVVAGEAGGITQHIGAYQVDVDGEKITFLDTPGHEAFTAMRSRGAQATDIVILVVAADDGIMQQTEEAINHAKAAEVPIIVAVNKIDKPGADVDRVKNELMRFELISEDFGGDIQVVPVSAKTGEGLDKLKEAILLQAEVSELKANPARKAAGLIIEAKIDKGRGVVATLLVQKGTLRVGDLVVAGSSWGRVRAMIDDKGVQVKEAIPSQPVEVLGLDEAPLAGDTFAVVDTERDARDITEYRIKSTKSKQAVVTARTLDQMFADATAQEKLKELVLVVKGDVQGSVEAIIGSVSKFNSDEVSVRVLHSGVGAITESDVALARATGGIIIGFNVRATAAARDNAAKEGVDIRYYSIIYNLIDDVKAALSGLLSPERRENLIGYAEIRQVFNITKAGKVAGCYVTEGTVKRGAGVRLLRDNVVIHEGKLKTLKRFKDEVKDVKSGFECGMAFENYDDIREGDMIECFEVEEIARTI